MVVEVGEGRAATVQGAEAAKTALNAITVSGSEACKAASPRLVVLYRAFIPEPDRPHNPVATFVWGCISKIQLSDLPERLVQMLLPSAFDESGLQGVVHERLLRIHNEIGPLQRDFAHPSDAQMTARGVKTESFLGGMVTLISARSYVYQQSTRNSLKGNFAPSQRFASVGGES